MKSQPTGDSHQLKPEAILGGSVTCTEIKYRHKRGEVAGQLEKHNGLFGNTALVSRKQSRLVQSDFSCIEYYHWVVSELSLGL